VRTELVNGGYYDQRQPAKAADLVANPRARVRLHELSGQLTTVDRMGSLR
jgi:hypothetical protein